MTNEALYNLFFKNKLQLISLWTGFISNAQQPPARTAQLYHSKLDVQRVKTWLGKHREADKQP